MSDPEVKNHDHGFGRERKNVKPPNSAYNFRPPGSNDGTVPYISVQSAAKGQVE